MTGIGPFAIYISSIAAAGASAGLLAGLSLLSSTSGQKEANRVLGVFLLILSVSLMQRYASYTGIVYDFPFLQGSTQYLKFLLGPCLLFYVCLLTQPGYTLDRSAWWHVAPAVLSLLIYIPVYLQPEDTKREFVAFYMGLDSPAGSEWSREDILALPLIGQINTVQIIAFFLHWGAYCLISLRLLYHHAHKLRDHFSATDRLTLQWLRNFTLLVLALNIVGLIFIIRYVTSGTLSIPENDLFPTILQVLIVFYVGFMGLRQLAIYTQTSDDNFWGAVSSFGDAVQKVKIPDVPDHSIAPRKYERSGLSLEEQQKCWQLLQEYMTTEKAYLTPGLTINDLADAMAMRSAHISQTINSEAETNFFDFVNQYRISEAQDLIRQKGTTVALSTLCYDVGFNSKAAFYNQFKKHSHGMTPKVYLKSLGDHTKSKS